MAGHHCMEDNEAVVVLEELIEGVSIEDVIEVVMDTKGVPGTKETIKTLKSIKNYLHQCWNPCLARTYSQC